MSFISKNNTGLGRRPMQPDWERFKRIQSGEIKNLDMSIIKTAHLVEGFLSTVNLNTVEVASDSGWETFRGMKVPNISFEFVSKEDDKAKEPAYYTHTFNIIDPSGKFGDGKSSVPASFTELGTYINHFTTVLLGDKAPDIDFPLDIFNDKGGVDVDKYKSFSADDIIKAFTTFFTDVEKAFFTGKGADRKMMSGDVLIWIKLTINEFKNNRFSFPNFRPAGGGVIERVNSTKIPNSLKFDPRFDVIIPVERKNRPTAAPGAGSESSLASAINNL